MAEGNTNKGGALQVLVSGGSIGGLATAIALRSQGHHVKVSRPTSRMDHVFSYRLQIYEQALIPDTVGGGITIFPNALKALKMLGIETTHVRATRVKQVSPVYGKNASYL